MHRISAITRSIKSWLSIVIVCLATVFLLGCGGVEGTYSGTQGDETMTIVLNGGKYTMTVKTPFETNPTPHTGDYTVDGKNLTLHGDIPLPFTIDGDKLIGPFGVALTKQ